MPTLSISDGVVGESAGFIDFIVRLDVASTDTITVSYNNYNGSAGFSDFTQNDGQLSFAPGQTQKTIRVPIVDDALLEGREYFHVELFSSINATIAKARGTAAIIDNDAPSGTPLITVRDVVVDEAAGQATFEITLNRPSTRTVALSYDTVNDTARAGFDYIRTRGSLVFQPGETAKTVTVALIDDAAREGLEAFGLSLYNVGRATILDPLGTATIGENDSPLRSSPTISIDDAVVGESDGYVDFVVRLDAPGPDPITVQYNNFNGSAGYSDFEQNDGYLTFAPGETTKVIRVAIVDDIAAEARETLHVSLFSPNGATVARAVGTAAIVDDDAPSGTPRVTIRDVVVDEADNQVSFVVTLDRPSTGVVSLDYTTEDQTAPAGRDYRAAAGALAFAPGETAKTVTVALIDDAVREGLEAFGLRLSNLSGATILDPLGTATIGENDAPLRSSPSISIDDAVVGESDGYVDFVVRLDGPGPDPIRVQYNNFNGSAGYSDFEQTDGYLTFAPGETTKVIRVPIVDDIATEARETLYVSLFNPSGATVARAVGTAAIVDDDAPSGTPIVTIRDLVLDEADNQASFVITLDRPSTGIVSLDYSTANGTARAISDYVATGGTLNFAPGETAKTVTVAILDDARTENAESFNLVLSNLSGATAIDPIGTATIGRNDSAPVAAPVLAIGSVTTPENGQYVDLVVSLNAPGAAPVTVQYNNYNGTAGYTDFEQNDGYLTFAPGETTKVVRVSIVDDIATESQENFFVSLFNPSNATIATAIGTVTILASDGTPAPAPRFVSADAFGDDLPIEPLVSRYVDQMVFGHTVLV